MISVKNTTLRLRQDVLDNTTFIHLATVSPNLKRHCNDDLPTRWKALADKNPVCTEIPTVIEARMTTPVLSTTFYDISAPSPASDMCCDGTGIGRLTIPPNPPTTPPSTLGTAIGGMVMSKKEEELYWSTQKKDHHT